MTGSTAKIVCEAMVSIGGQLNESLRLVRETESEEVFRDYRLQVAMIMAALQDRIMNPLYVEHPELKPPGLG
ncbi:hypothetical protein P2318_32525 [Myxococcaceae bacterium GXIMD 01537]